MLNRVHSGNCLASFLACNSGRVGASGGGSGGGGTGSVDDPEGSLFFSEGFPP